MPSQNVLLIDHVPAIRQGHIKSGGVSLQTTSVFPSLSIKEISCLPLAPSIFKLTERSSGPFDPRRFARSSLALLLSFQLPLHGGVTSSAFTSRPRPRFTYLPLTRKASRQSSKKLSVFETSMMKYPESYTGIRISIGNACREIRNRSW